MYYVFLPLCQKGDFDLQAWIHTSGQQTGWLYMKTGNAGVHVAVLYVLLSDKGINTQSEVRLNKNLKKADSCGISPVTTIRPLLKCLSGKHKHGLTET